MHKIYDHYKSYKGWFEVEDPAKYIAQAFNSERYSDRDSCVEYLIEHYDSVTGVHTYHVASISGWYAYVGVEAAGGSEIDDDEDDYDGSPSMDVTVLHTAEEAKSYGTTPTKFHPMRDYLRVSKFAHMNWPPKVA